MNKNDLLFYEAYEGFYGMAERSAAFRAYCKDAFGEDFSQDGFSDTRQIDMILPYIPQGREAHILDAGCGNGKMLGYLQRKTGAFIHGFDYSPQAIRCARLMFPERSDFREGVIGETDYPAEMFDVVTAMDSVYFAKDMTAFIAQVKKWLKKGGVFFAGYQEGDVMPRTENIDTAELSKALRANGMSFEVSDITAQTYELLRKKRRAALAHRTEFELEGNTEWFDLLMIQTECAEEPYPIFREQMARYIYVCRK